MRRPAATGSLAADKSQRGKTLQSAHLRRTDPSTDVTQSHTVKHAAHARIAVVPKKSLRKPEAEKNYDRPKGAEGKSRM